MIVQYLVTDCTGAPELTGIVILVLTTGLRVVTTKLKMKAKLIPSGVNMEHMSLAFKSKMTATHTQMTTPASMASPSNAPLSGASRLMLGKSVDNTVIGPR